MKDFHAVVQNEIKTFLNDNSNYEIKPLTGDASVRRYYRIIVPDEDNYKSYILALVEPFHGRIFQYPQLNIAKHLLNHNIPVPRIYHSNLHLGTIFQEDLGDILLENYIANADYTRLSHIYASIIRDLIKIHSLPHDSSCVAYSYSFDVPKLMFEFNFFIEHLIEGHYQQPLHSDNKNNLLCEFEKIAKLIANTNPKVFTHRDFHSRNIMIYSGKNYFIDYQDARLGIMQYDLCSLLKDSYVKLPQKLVEDMIILYYNLANGCLFNNVSFDKFRHIFDIMAFQRNVKACGTFGYQAHALNNKRYIDSLRRTLSYLKDYFKVHSELKKIELILKNYIEELN